MRLSFMRKEFDASDAIDAGSCERYASIIRSHQEPYSAEEEAALREGMSHFATFGAEKSKQLKLQLPSVEAKSFRMKGDGHIWGWVKVPVIKASPEWVVASILDYTKRSGRKYDEVAKSTNVINDHNQELYVRASAKKCARAQRSARERRKHSTFAPPPSPPYPSHAPSPTQVREEIRARAVPRQGLSQPTSLASGWH
jgi:hypothetical protein